MRNKEITICACTSRSFIDKKKVALLATELKEKGYEVSIVADLCEMAMNRSPELEEMADTNILACYPRAIQSQMDWLNLQANNVHDIRNNETDVILAEFDIISPAANRKEADSAIVDQINELRVTTGSDAWYPVLDKSKCTNCGKCHDFCLFGVYTIENKEVKVAQPQNCKNNCPACARICPAGAIIFPKYPKSPINGGTKIEEEFSKDDMEAAYQKRLEYRLQQNRKRFSLLKKDNPAPVIPGNLVFKPKKNEILVIGTDPPCPRCGLINNVVKSKIKEFGIDAKVRHLNYASQETRQLAAEFGLVPGTAKDVSIKINKVINKDKFSALSQDRTEADKKFEAYNNCNWTYALDESLRPFEEKAKEVGILMTPALIINGELKHSGSVPGLEKIEEWLLQLKKE